MAAHGPFTPNPQMTITTYRNLGRSGIKISPLTLGTMMFGGETDRATAQRITERAFEQGVNFIDTANNYNRGESEVVVGELIAPRRGEWVLASKFGNQNPGTTGPNDRGAARINLIRSVEASLKRLRTDYLDVLYLHREDGSTQIEETVRALGDLIRAGKLRSYGLSNHRAYKLAEFVHTADALGVDRPAVTQPLYNLANRQIEVEHLPAAERYGLAVVPYSPLARGVLTAKYTPGEAPAAETRAGRDDPRLQQTEWRAESLHIAQQIRAHVAGRGITPGQFALAWVLHNRLVTSAIAGPRTLAQWEDYLPALQYCFTEEDEALVDRLVPTGHASAPGFNDPAHPFFGRQPRHRAP